MPKEKKMLVICVEVFFYLKFYGNQLHLQYFTFTVVISVTYELTEEYKRQG